MLGVTLVTGTARRTKQYCESFQGTVWHYNAQTLPNPYSPGGTDKAIRKRLHAEPAFEAMVCRIVRRVLRTWGSTDLYASISPTIVIRCAFGKHRSVMVADEVAKRLLNHGECDVATMHLSVGIE